MRKIAMVNQKGGVGKTTTAVHLAAALARLGRRVLLVDLDPQANATISFGLRPHEIKDNIYTLLMGHSTVSASLLSVSPRRPVAPSPRRGGGLGGVAALSLVAGLGFWTNALILPYLILAAMLATIRAVRARAPIRLAAGAAAFVVGSLPLWLVNLSSGFPTFQELRQANTGASPGEIVSNLGQILRYSGPVLLGLIEPSSNLPAFHEARHERYALWVAGVAATAVLAAGLVGALLAWVVDRRSGDLVLGFVALGVVMSFAVSRVAPLHVGEPRYALPLYSLAPLYLARLAALAEKRPRLAWGALGLLLAMNLGTTLSFTPELAAPRVGGMPLPRSNQELIQALDARGIDRVYTDYWIAYPLAFESGERILPSVITDDLASGFNRYIPYAQAVHDAPRPAYVFIRGSPPDVAYQARPATALPGYRRDEMGPYMIYWAGDRGRGEE
ncbi:MAG: AAA family ATPase [Chloroflexi bacterium]|nr:AAA family ATPase [Chloroflexota bacterium]